MKITLRKAFFEDCPTLYDLQYAQIAIEQAEALYPNAKKWSLDTIFQEGKLCYLYEKVGYRKTGRTRNLQPIRYNKLRKLKNV